MDSIKIKLTIVFLSIFSIAIAQRSRLDSFLVANNVSQEEFIEDHSSEYNYVYGKNKPKEHICKYLPFYLKENKRIVSKYQIPSKETQILLITFEDPFFDKLRELKENDCLEEMINAQYFDYGSIGAKLVGLYYNYNDAAIYHYKNGDITWEEFLDFVYFRSITQVGFHVEDFQCQ